MDIKVVLGVFNTSISTLYWFIWNEEYELCLHLLLIDFPNSNYRLRNSCNTKVTGNETLAQNTIDLLGMVRLKWKFWKCPFEIRKTKKTQLHFPSLKTPKKYSCVWLYFCCVWRVIKNIYRTCTKQRNSPEHWHCDIDHINIFRETIQ